jgi:hypothetical protein
MPLSVVMCPLVVVEGQQHLPVVHAVNEPWIRVAERDQIGPRDEAEGIEDRLRKVLVEREQAGHAGPRLGRDRAEVPAQVATWVATRAWKRPAETPATPHLLAKRVGREGLEPSTLRLRVSCSTS